MLSDWESTQQNNTITRFEGDTVLNDLQQLFCNKHYDLVIERTAKVLEELQQGRVAVQQEVAHILELRMKAWEAKSCYMNALTDAQGIIKYAPHDPKGYLWSGQLCARFDKHEQGIEILKKG